MFRLLVAYDGTEFHGWQVQPQRRTVQGTLMDALAQVLGGPVAALHGAGRTDAGVHARGQVASFESATTLPASALPPLLARALPGDVRVRAAAEAPAGFHARHSARGRRYRYRLLDRDDVLDGRFAWWPRHAPDRERLAAASAPLVGAHDCTSFRAAGSSPADPVCRIETACWSAADAGPVLDIAADHFLYHMVRNVVGTVLDAARTPDPAATMRAVLAARDRAAAGRTAPPHGLSLEHVVYPGDAAS